jgi:hypothetical protein
MGAAESTRSYVSKRDALYAMFDKLARGGMRICFSASTGHYFVCLKPKVRRSLHTYEDKDVWGTPYYECSLEDYCTVRGADCPRNPLMVGTGEVWRSY